METLLHGKDDVWESDSGSLGVGWLEMIFHAEQQTLTRVRITFSHWDGLQSWQELLNIPWVDWAARTPRSTIEQLLDANRLPFRSILYTDDSSGILVLKSPATIHLGYEASGAPLALVVDFQERYQMLLDIRGLQGFHF